MTDRAPDGATEEAFLNAAVSAAEDAVAELAASFLDWVGNDLARAREALGVARSAPDDRVETALGEIFDVYHNVKGQGGSFGYDLLSTVADALCEVLREAPRAGNPPFAVLEAHMTAAEFIIARAVKGDGGAHGHRLMARLGELRAA
jgi:chemotaxis protein histidine kinase CheA